MSSYDTGKKLTELTPEDRAKVRREWDEAIARVRARKREAPVVLTHKRDRKEVKAKLVPTQEHCESCSELSSDIRPVEEKGRWRYLCPGCRG